MTGGGLFQPERFMVRVLISLTDLLTADLDNPGYGWTKARAAKHLAGCR